MRIGLIVNGRLHALAANHLYDVQLVDWLYHMDDDVAVIPLCRKPVFTMLCATM
ncbi:MAG: hypothetical protein M5U34_11950 [Chloroflexi bacterium]|nr:hypothetical protein [Chloroflexota bacterium]